MARHGPSWCALLLGTVSLNGLVFADEIKAQASVSENDFFNNDIPIVLSASRMQQTPATAPVAITVIDRQMIEASGFTEIADLFRLVPGFFVDYDSGHVQAVGYHLLPDRYVRQQQVLIDGRSVYTPTLGGIPWTDLPITIDDIDRIEVIRGPNAVSYGSNSFLGVINIITRHASLDSGTSFKANLGTHALRQGFLRQGGNIAGIDYRVNVGYRSDDGFDNRYDDKHIRMVNTRLDYQINNYNDLSFQAGYSDGPRQIDSVYGGEPNHESTVTNQFQQLRWENKTNSDSGFTFQLYHTQIQENNYYIQLFDISGVTVPIPFDVGTRGERYDAELQFNNKTPDGIRYIYGVSYRLDRVTSQLYFGTNSALDSRYRRLFGSVELPVTSATLVNLGVMAENNEIVGTEISPRIAINHNLSNTETIRFTYSKATRTPVIFEALPDAKITSPAYDQLFFNAGTVTSEHISSYDIGLIGTHPLQQFNYDVRAFYEDVTGLIGTRTITPYPDITNESTYFNNFDDALIRGLELQLDWHPWQMTTIHAGMAHIDIRSENITEKYSTSAPVNSSLLLAMQKFSDGYSASVGVYHRSNMKPLADSSTFPALMPPMTRIDVRVARELRSDKFTQLISLTVQNITNEQSVTILNNSIDRRTYVSYKIDF